MGQVITYEMIEEFLSKLYGRTLTKEEMLNVLNGTGYIDISEKIRAELVKKAAV